MLKALKDVTRSAFALKLLCGVIGAYIRFTLNTTRWTIEGVEHFNAVNGKDAGFVLALWHQRLMMAPIMRQNIQRTVFMLISRNRDGEVIAGSIASYDVQFIRGSANNPKKVKNKSGARAMSEMIDKITEGAVIGVTVDGPRGPAFSAKPGVVRLAGKTGCAIVPLSFAMSGRKTFNSWDNFHLGLPFSRGAVVIGEPLYVKETLTGQALTQACDDLSNSLQHVTHRADDMVSASAVSQTR